MTIIFTVIGDLKAFYEREQEIIKEEANDYTDYIFRIEEVGYNDDRGDYGDLVITISEQDLSFEVDNDYIYFNSGYAFKGWEIYTLNIKNFKIVFRD